MHLGGRHGGGSWATAGAAALVAMACGEEPGRLLVVVDTDYDVPEEVETVRAVTRTIDGAQVSSVDFTLTDVARGGVSAFEVPFSFAVEPLGGDNGRRVRLEVSPFLDQTAAEPLFTRTAVTGFRAGEARILPMFLARRCEDERCPAGLTCTELGCVDEVVDPGDLQIAQAWGDELDLACDTCPGRTVAARGVSGALEAAVAGVAVDLEGRAVAVGYVKGEADLGAGLDGEDGTSADPFVLIVAADGTLVQAARIEGAGDGHFRDVAALPDGGFVVSGNFERTLELGTSTLRAVNGDDAFAAAFRRDGSVRWATRLGGPSAQYSEAVAVAPDGQVFVAVTFERVLQVGEPSLSSAGARDAAVVALDGTTGAVRWRAGFGGPRSDLVHGVATDATGRVYLVGTVDGPVDFGLGPTAPLGDGDGDDDDDGFLLGLDGADGTPLFAERFGGAGDEAPFDAAGRAEGAVVVGWSNGPVRYRDRVLEPNGGRDSFVLAVRADGSLVWATHVGGAGEERASSVGVDAAGRAVVGGSYEGAAELGLGPRTSVGAEDGFVLVLDAPDGRPLWGHELIGPGDDDVWEIAVGREGTVWAGGVFTGSLDARGMSLEGPATVQTGFLVTLGRPTASQGDVAP